MNGRPLATTVEVAQHLGKEPATLAQWRYRRVGPPWIKVGAEVRYRWEDVEQWLDEQTERTS